MEINLTGSFWGWPYNLTGELPGRDALNLIPEFNTNITDFNIFNFSGEATANLTFFSIIAVVGITVLICNFLIKNIAKLTPSHSNELCNKYDTNHGKLSIYSRLCGQRILTYNYNMSYLSLLSNKNLADHYKEAEIIEKIAASNKDLLELIGLSLLVFPNCGAKDIDYFVNRAKDILWLGKNAVNPADYLKMEKNIQELDAYIGELLNHMKKEIIEEKTKSRLMFWK